METVTRRLLIALAAAAICFAAFASGYFTATRRTSENYTIVVERGGEMILDYEEADQNLAPVLININTATLEELQRLDGIGPALAQQIIDYRERIGGFTYTFQLLDVSGIGEKLYERIQDHVTL
ncbi:MAG: helix-hairpin-helix domain-containing protein [Oscillospiraceae bacterium]|jgi:competence protein ComEA|nr:helix-hairpin-helix domain-containing protein [Oscillospiraceae bacterium]